MSDIQLPPSPPETAESSDSEIIVHEDVENSGLNSTVIATVISDQEVPIQEVLEDEKKTEPQSNVVDDNKTRSNSVKKSQPNCQLVGDIPKPTASVSILAAKKMFESKAQPEKKPSTGPKMRYKFEQVAQKDIGNKSGDVRAKVKQFAGDNPGSLKSSNFVFKHNNNGASDGYSFDIRDGNAVASSETKANNVHGIISGFERSGK